MVFVNDVSCQASEDDDLSPRCTVAVSYSMNEEPSRSQTRESSVILCLSPTLVVMSVIFLGLLMSHSREFMPVTEVERLFVYAVVKLCVVFLPPQMLNNKLRRKKSVKILKRLKEIYYVIDYAEHDGNIYFKI